MKSWALGALLPIAFCTALSAAATSSDAEAAGCAAKAKRLGIADPVELSNYIATCVDESRQEREDEELQDERQKDGTGPDRQAPTPRGF